MNHKHVIIADSASSRSGQCRGPRAGRRDPRRLRPGLLELEGRRLLANLTVMNTNASGPGSLFAAIETANGNDQANAITFSQSAFSTLKTITLGGSALELSDTAGPQTITGPPAGVSISGGGLSGVFQIESGVTAILSGLIITDGSTAKYHSGAGVDNQGTLILSGCTINGNNSGDSGGGLYNGGTATVTECTFGDNTAATGGGGVVNWVTGSLNMFNCLISANKATNNGGGLYISNTAVLSDCTISDNSSGENGGGLANHGTVNLTDCTIGALNSAANVGGGVMNFSSATLTACTISGNTATLGAGVFNSGTATLTDSIVAGNTKSSGPSDLHNNGTMSGSFNLIGTGGAGPLTNGADHNIVLTSLTNLGLAPLNFYGGPTETMALLPGSAAIGAGTASVSGITIPGTDQRGFARSGSVDIGAFQSQSSPLVVNTTADGSACPSGDLDLRGAVDLADVLPSKQPITFSSTLFATLQTITLNDGPLVLSNASEAETITGPTAGVIASGGGASGVFQIQSGTTATLVGLTITNGKADSANPSGGVANYGTVALTDCAISGNLSTTGGGVYNDGTATLTDCTISGNSAETAGGIENAKSSSLSLVACTVSNNLIDFPSGGGVNNNGTATLTDTIVAGNYDGTEFANGSEVPTDIIGTVSGTYNLIGIGGSGGLSNGSNHNIVLSSLTSLGLAPLGNYGGPTQTMALLPGSAAIGAGTASASGVSIPSTDQRGLKLDHPNPDIGAFQSQGFVITVLGGTPQSATISTGFASPLEVSVKANNPVEPVIGGTVSFADPSSGASATFSPSAATINASGQASVTATANLTVGAYAATAKIGGTDDAGTFKLKNTPLETHVVLTTLDVYKDKKVTSLRVTAQVEPALMGLGIAPTGTVIFELVQKNKKPKVLVKTSLKGGKATLDVGRPSSVFNKSIEVVYEGNSDCSTNETITMIKPTHVGRQPTGAGE
jgi:hypothetical protein